MHHRRSLVIVKDDTRQASRSSFKSNLRETLQPGGEQQNITLSHNLCSLLLGLGALQNHVVKPTFGNRAPQDRLIPISSASDQPEACIREAGGCPQKMFPAFS